MSLRDEQSAFVCDIVALLNFAWQQNFDVTFGEAQRTIEQQKLYVSSGRSHTMDSNHIRRCAFDLFFFDRPTGELVLDKKRLQVLGDYWESLNSKNSWGGNWHSFKDLPHFERRQ